MSVFKAVKSRSVIFLILFCSFAVLLAIADRAPLHLEKNCPCIHFTPDINTYLDGVLQMTSPGPYVYRIFIPYLATGIHSITPYISLINIDLILKIFFLIVCQITFYWYLRNFYSPFISLAGVFILDILLSFTFSSILGPSIGENADLMNLAVFTLALAALYKNSLVYFLIILFIGTFNRETTWFLIPILILSDFVPKKGFYRSIVACFIFAIPYVGLRFMIQASSPGWLTTEAITRNIPFLSNDTTIPALIANAHTIFLLGPLILISLLHFNKHHQFLRLAFYITPLFIILHYIFGSIIETRLWLPLFVILIPTFLDSMNRIINEQSFQAINKQEVN